MFRGIATVSFYANDVSEAAHWYVGGSTLIYGITGR